MILDKIKTALGLAPKKTMVELLITIERIERRMVLLENGRLEEFQIERPSDMSIAGSIFKGRVRNIEAGLKALFVDIGHEKNAFLHYWDAMPAALDEVETVDRGGNHKPRRRIQVADIPKLYPVGSDIIVQVTKGPIGTKGARITTNISLPGRFLVLTPFSDQFGISRKIADNAERQRLRKILKELDVPEGMGVIIRTVGEGQKARFFVRDLAFLLEQWQEVQRNLETKASPAMLLPETDLVGRAVRDFLTDEVDRIVVDDEEAANRIRSLIGQVSKRSVKKVKFYQDPVPLFEKFGIHTQLETSFGRQVQLKGGGSLVIDETEALVAIDVNTGRAKSHSDKDDTIFQTNLEAAEEIARQLRLRNMGGIIILDFIDMKSRKDQNAVYQRLRAAMQRDKAKTHVLPISPLGLIEMTRQRTDESVSRTVYTDCPHCKGRGVLRSAETMSLEVQRAIARAVRNHPDQRELRVIIHPTVLARLREEDDDALVEMERKNMCKLSFRADSTLNNDHYRILDANTDKELLSNCD
jgi:ribonuclease G